MLTKARLANEFADWLGLPFVETADGGCGPPAGSYLIPTDTICGSDEAARLGIHSADDLLGGVVPHAFVATKVITHPLVDEDSPAPTGWAALCGPSLARVTLDGYSAFSVDDAFAGGCRLLDGGPVRVKLATGVGSRGQWVVRTCASLQQLLSSLSADQVRRHGMVLERNLDRVVTRSVGLLRLPGDRLVSYYGTQATTSNHRGETVYGGSQLTMVRGGYDELLATEPPIQSRIAILQASMYHDMVMRCYPGTLASRSNYDVAQGVDADGHWCSGVLEQSWRIGGATGAELVGLRALDRDPALACVTTRSEEVYGGPRALPPGALVLYDDDDPQEGRLLKFAAASTDVGT